MAKQQSSPPKTSTATATSTETAPVQRAATAQDTVGNASLAATVPAVESPESSLLAEEVVPVHKKRGPTNTTAGATATDAKTAAPTTPADPVSRAAKITKGMPGALISGGADILVKSDAGLKGSTVATVSDGTPCHVTDVGAASVKVTVRQGQKNVAGWVSTAVFSDQPGLKKDEDNTKLDEDLEYNKIEGDLTAGGMPDKKKPTTQGGLGDCYFISSMAALHFANPEFAKTLCRWDDKKKRYIVKFYESGTKGKAMTPVEIEVDGYLPTSKSSPSDPAYAGDPGDAMWGAIVEKAYAKWKGGYDVIEGGDGAQAMQEMTGVKSAPKNPASMKEADVIPYFKKAQTDGLAIYAGVINSIKVAQQTPFSGSAGKYTANVAQQHEWNEIQVDSLSITDKSGGVASARDQGEEEAKTGKIVGTDVKSGEVQYKDNKVSVDYKAGKAPKTAGDLQLDFETHGVVLPSKTLIGNHAYAFSGVTAQNELQFYNPWGSYQPKPLTAAEFIKFFDSLSTNAVPKTKTGG